MEKKVVYELLPQDYDREALYLGEMSQGWETYIWASCSYL